MTLRVLVASILLHLALLGAAANPGLAAEQGVDFDALEGKVVVLDFWASWCVPCRRSFPWLNSMHEKYSAAGLIIIGVNLDNDAQEARAFLDEFPAQFRIHYDEQKTLAIQFDVIAMPSSYIIGRDGQVAKRHLGFKVKKQEEYEAAIAAALAEEGAVH